MNNLKKYAIICMHPTIRSVIEDDDSREQLVAIIKHIRRGKEIVDGRLEV